MGRPIRNDVAGGWYHVVNRGVARTAIFRDDRDRVEFERLLGLAHSRFGVSVHAYCWMSNHYHLVLECPDAGLSDAIHVVASVYVRHFNERHGRDGPLFRDRFYAKPILSDGYLVRLVRYIRRNPLAFAPADQLVRYPWSSLRTYLGHRRAPTWLATQTLLEVCGGREQLARLVLDDCAIGIGRVDAEAWSSAIDLAIDESEVPGRRGVTTPTIAWLLLDRLEGDDRTEVGRLLHYPNRDSEYAARSRARRQLRTNPGLATIVDTALDLAA